MYPANLMFCRFVVVESVSKHTPHIMLPVNVEIVRVTITRRFVWYM